MGGLMVRAFYDRAPEAASDPAREPIMVGAIPATRLA
jgi:hypothetical protein